MDSNHGGNEYQRLRERVSAAEAMLKHRDGKQV
jgi:hypothetical protein